MERMKKLSQLSQEFSPEEKIKRFNRVESQSAELGVAPPPLASCTTEVEHVIDDVSYTYIDFARRDSDGLNIPTFRIQDYSWDDHGYSLINRYYNDVGNLLDYKFKIAYNLTYYTLAGRTEVDTSRFRRAIWNYVQCLFGKFTLFILPDIWNYVQCLFVSLPCLYCRTFGTCPVFICKFTCLYCRTFGTMSSVYLVSLPCLYCRTFGIICSFVYIAGHLELCPVFIW
ncbi:hypothetical protein WDU94_001199 [Cyamophila willieti]